MSVNIPVPHSSIKVLSDSPATRCVQFLAFAISRHNLGSITEVALQKDNSVPLRRMGEEEKATIHSLHQQGKNPNEISKAIGFSCAAVTRFMENSGLRRRLTVKKIENEHTL